MKQWERDARDEAAALAAVRLAMEGGRPGIAVDDMEKAGRMLARVERLAKARGLVCALESLDAGFIVKFETGQVFVFAVDMLAPKAAGPRGA